LSRNTKVAVGPGQLAGGGARCANRCKVAREREFLHGAINRSIPAR
jgi:hypothetical protein